MSKMAAIDLVRQENQIEVGGIIFVTEYLDGSKNIEEYSSWDSLFEDHIFTAEAEADVSAHPYSEVSAAGNFAHLVRVHHVIALDADGNPLDPEPGLSVFMGKTDCEVVGMTPLKARLTLPPCRFRKDKKSGGWKVMGPLAAIEGQREVEVMKGDGMRYDTEIDPRTMSRPFDIDGVPHVYVEVNDCRHEDADNRGTCYGCGGYSRTADAMG